MPRTYAYSANFDSETERLLKGAEFLGEGHNGIVFEIPEEKVLKIFTEDKCCKEEGETLKRISKSKYFPRIYVLGDNYIVRDKVYGRRLDEYIREWGLNFEISKSLYYMIKEFRRLNFTKIDTRCKDIYINNNKLMLIDPKHCYRRKINYPRHLLKGLKRLGVLEEFIEDIKRLDKKTALAWKKNFEDSLKEK